MIPLSHRDLYVGEDRGDGGPGFRGGGGGKKSEFWAGVPEKK